VWLAAARAVSKAENVSSLVQLADREKLRFGRGRLEEVAYSPTGDELAAATGLGVWLYPKDRPGQGRLLPHAVTVHAVAWSPDGARLATGGEDSVVRIWDASTGAQERTVPGCSGTTIDDLAWSPDGARIASVCSQVFATEVNTGQAVQLANIDFFGSEVRWSPDSMYMAVTGYEWTNDSILGNAGIWDARSGKPVRTLIAGDPGMQAESVDWSPDGGKIAVGLDRVTMSIMPNGVHRITSIDGETRIYDAVSGAVVTSSPTDNAVNSVRWSPDGSVLAIGSQRVTLWNPATGVQAPVERGLGSSTLAWSPDGKRLAGASWTGVVTVWDAASGDIVRTLAGHPFLGRHVAWSENGRQAISLDMSGSVDAWDAASGKSVQRYPFGSFVALSPNGSRAVSMESKSTLVVKILASGATQSTLAGTFGPGPEVFWSPDGTSVAVLSDDLEIRLFDAHTGEQRAALGGHLTRIGALAWAPNSQSLASGSGDGELRVWDAASGALDQVIATGDYGVADIAWSPGGDQLATATNRGKLGIWDAATGGSVRTLKSDKESDDYHAVAWSPDGDRIAAGANAGGIQVFAAATGQLLLTLAGHGGEVSDLAWSPDGGQLLSGSSGDGTVRIWDVSDTTAFVPVATAAPAPSAPPVESATPAPTSTLAPAAGGLAGKIVFLSSRDYGDRRTDTQAKLGPHDIYAMNPDGSGVRRITTGLRLGNMHSPVVSPDGSQIIIGGYSPGGARLFSADGKLLRKIPLPGTAGWALDWSPDGKVLFCIFMSGGLEEELYSLDVATGAATRLTNDTDRELFGSWSPDGRQIAFMRHYELWTMNADGSGQKLVISGEARDLDWSPDGTMIAMESDETPHEGMDFEVYLIRPDGTERRAITSTPGIMLYNPNWSPDGARLVVETYADYPPKEGQITIVNAATGALTTLTSEGNNFAPFWALDE
jgi:WD40 repeat protein